MKHTIIALVLSCVLVTIATGCSLFKLGAENTSNGTPISSTPISNNNGNIAVYGKTDIYTYLFSEVLGVTLTPTNNAEANTVYVVDLYENGIYRASSSVKWNQPEINIKASKDVYFSLSHEEYQAYNQCWVIDGCYLTDIFSASVHQSPTPTPIAEVIYEITGTAEIVNIRETNILGTTGYMYNIQLPQEYTYSPFLTNDLYIYAENLGAKGSVTVSIYLNGDLIASSTNSSPYGIAEASGHLNN